MLEHFIFTGAAESDLRQGQYAAVLFLFQKLKGIGTVPGCKDAFDELCLMDSFGRLKIDFTIKPDNTPES